MYKADGPKGIGGWLILPLIGLVITTISTGAMWLTTYIPIFVEGTWSEYTEQSGSAYHPMMGLFVSFEMVSNTLIGVLAVVLLVMMFAKHYLFPKGMIGFLLANVVFNVIYLVVVLMIPVLVNEIAIEAGGDIFRSCIGATIWVPYFIKSKRVKNTFVKPPPMNSPQSP